MHNNRFPPPKKFLEESLTGSPQLSPYRVCYSLKARSHDPILEIRFLVPKIGSRRSNGPISRFRFCGENVERSFVVCSHDSIFRTNKESSIWRQSDRRDIMQIIFQEECRMKIEHVLFPSVFSKLRILCRKVIFNVFTRSDFWNQQKSDR